MCHDDPDSVFPSAIQYDVISEPGGTHVDGDAVQRSGRVQGAAGRRVLTSCSGQTQKYSA